MNETPDSSLLLDYHRDGLQAAFAELVSRHADWVYSMAVRLVGSRPLAEDVTQGVFLALAQNAERLNGRSVRGWLFKATRYVASTALRAESRRRKHERRAAMMNTPVMEIAQPGQWENISPRLDEFIARLRKSEREAVLLRFFESKSMSEVGAAMGVSEDAARKRIDRAVHKLRGSFRNAGLTITAASLIALLAANTTKSAPAILKSACATLSVSAAASSFAQGVSQMILRAKLRLASVIGMVLMTMCSSLAAVILAQADGGATPAEPASRPAVVQTTGTTEPAVLTEEQQMESWWADLAEADPKCDRALLHFAAQPDKTVAFLQTKMLPLSITPERVHGLLTQLGSSDEAVWKPAFDELSYFDPRLAISLPTLMDTVTTNPTRERLVEILNGYPPGTMAGMTITLRRAGRAGPETRPQYNFQMARGGRGGGAVWAEYDVSKIAQGSSISNSKMSWTRAVRGIVLLDQIGTPDAIAILNQMATGNPDALPTQVAKETLAERR